MKAVTRRERNNRTAEQQNNRTIEQKNNRTTVSILGYHAVALVRIAVAFVLARVTLPFVLLYTTIMIYIMMFTYKIGSPFPAREPCRSRSRLDAACYKYFVAE